MATNTYIALDTKTVSGTSTGTISLTAIPQNYTDLRIVFNGGANVDSNLIMRYNGDSTSTLYSYTFITADGSTATSGRAANANQIFTNYFGYMSSAFSTNINIDILNYANSSVFKTNFARSTNSANGMGQINGLWRNNAPITSIDLIASGNNFLNGTTVSLYGILAEGVTPVPKATGGTIYSDSSYYYHVFGQTGVFTPTTSISADILCVAGGGAGTIGGGGAGGLLSFTSQSLTATNYTVTVGAGGTALTNNVTSGSQGTGSQFGALTATVGGGAGGLNDNNTSPTSLLNGGSGGGSGGSGSTTAPNGTGTSGQGNNGGNSGGITASPFPGGGGGGAGAAGSNAPANTTGGNGGIGATSSLINAIALASGTGQYNSANGNYYFAGGGGGGGNGVLYFGQGGFGGGANASNVPVANALPNLGGGGGGYNGGLNKGGNGGSGIIVVRYLKA